MYTIADISHASLLNLPNTPRSLKLSFNIITIPPGSVVLQIWEIYVSSSPMKSFNR
jgi:hypothetical protein